MKTKRIIFVLFLIGLFGCCYYVMNQHYDELARYPYELSDDEREVVLAHLDAEGINYLVTQKIEPDQFLPFLEIEDFDLNNTLWYTRAMATREEDAAYIVNFINKYRDHMQYGALVSLLTNYNYNVLTRFYDEGSPYGENLNLIADPTQRYTLIKKTQTLYTYEPKSLVVITDLPHDNIVDNLNDILIQEEVVTPLKELLAAAKEINQKEYGDMTIIAGYMSYEDQIALFEQMKKEYATDFDKRWDLPGQSEYQLGYTISLRPNEDTSQSDVLSTEEKEQANWLKENAYKYGFIIRYAKQKESVTGKTYQPYTLRYVGKETAKIMYDQEKAMEEMDFTAVK